MVLAKFLECSELDSLPQLRNQLLRKKLSAIIIIFEIVDSKAYGQLSEFGDAANLSERDLLLLCLLLKY